MQIPVKHFKVIGLPSETEPNAFYYIFDEENDLAAAWITNEDGDPFPVANIDELIAMLDSYYSKTEADNAIAAAIDQLKGGVETAYDTLVELADKLGDDDDAIAALVTALAGKISSSAKGQPSGVCDLDESGYIPRERISPKWVADKSGRLSLPPETPIGTEIYQADTGELFKLVATDTTDEASYKNITTPTDLGKENAAVKTDDTNKRVLLGDPNSDGNGTLLDINDLVKYIRATGGSGPTAFEFKVDGFTGVILLSASSLQLEGQLMLDGNIVSYGAKDSAGAGYRQLRVPNA
jgi:hypothetical protein